MKKEPVVLSWTKDELTQLRLLNRHEMYELFLGIKNGFQAQNPISTVLVEKIPTLERISIDLDRDESMDIPFITLVSDTNNIETLEVPKIHRIIWSIFYNYMEEDGGDFFSKM